VIVVRRLLTVPLAILLTLALVLTLVAHRANRTVLSADFYREQLTAVGAFDAVHDEVLPHALDDFLTEQDEQIPDNLKGIALPTDAASRAVILEFARTALPPEYLESLSGDAIEALFGYLKGDTDELAFTVSLNEPLTTAFLANPGPSRFEGAWRELDISNTAFAGLSGSIEIPELALLRNPLSVEVLARLRADDMTLEDAMVLVTAGYEATPANAEVHELTQIALAGEATVEELENLKTLLVVTRFIPPESAQQLVDAVAPGTQPDDDLLTVLLGTERNEAIRWFEVELFGAIRALSSYLAGDTEHFAIRIDFSAYPELATVAAGALNSDPDTLLRDGFRLNDVDIQRELDAGENPPISSLEDARAIFTPGGRTFGIEDFPAGDEASAPADVSAAPSGPTAGLDSSSGGGLDLERVQPFTAAFATWARPAGIAGVILLALLIGLLGGRQWWSRGTWAASAVAVPALLVVVAAGPVYGVTAAPRLAEAVDDRQAELLADGGPTSALAIRTLDRIEAVADSQASAFVANGAAASFLALLLGAAAVGWHVSATRRRSAPHPSEDVNELLRLPMAPEEPPADDEARAA